MGAGRLTGGDRRRRDDILGVILAGGQSRRFGTDKANALLAEDRLIEHVLARARPQVGVLAISGRDYGLGLPVIPDAAAGQGPLGGIVSALAWAGDAGFSAIATFSCDAPFFPLDLVERLADGWPAGTACRVAISRGTRHPTFAVWSVSALDRLQHVYDGGCRAVGMAQNEVGVVEVPFQAVQGPASDAFFNINTSEDYVAAQAWLADQRRMPMAGD